VVRSSAASDVYKRQMKAGDFLLFYFSGHGTSAFDAANRPMAAVIGPNSGALVPYDLDMSSPEAVSGSLIIGHRDIRPMLQQVDRKAGVFVILDSCYSGNAAKAAGPVWEGPTRAINLVAEMASKVRAAPSLSQAAGAVEVVAAEETDSYPYANVVAFSAASKSEPARDINTAMLQSGRFETFDGLPHGAFSNALFSALEGPGDANGDGQLTYGELFRAIRESVQKHHRQTPQVQVPEEGALRLPVFSLGTGVRPSPAVPVAARPTPGGAVTAPERPVRVRLALEGVSAGERQQFSAIAGVGLTEGAHDLLVRREPAGWALFHRSHFLIRRYAMESFAELAGRIAAHGDVRMLEDLQAPAATFLLDLDARPVGRKVEAGAPFSSHYRIGEEFSLLASLERQAYLLVFNPVSYTHLTLPTT
jgi:hypothetical protein